MNTNEFNFNENNSFDNSFDNSFNSSFNTNSEGNKRDQIIKKISELQSSTTFSKLTDTIRNIISLVVYSSMLISSWTFYNMNVKHSSEPTFTRIVFYIFLLVSITFVCGIIKSATLLYLNHVIERKLNVYNCTDDELVLNEKTARLILAVCDLLNALIPNIFAVIIGLAFIAAGIYFGLFAGENSQLGFLFVFPLMALGLIIASSLPTIRSAKMIIAIKRDIDYNEYNDNNANNFNSKRLLSIISGLVFLVSGLLCVITGISNIGTDKEMIDKIGFILFGIPFGAIGTFLIISNNKFN